MNENSLDSLTPIRTLLLNQFHLLDSLKGRQDFPGYTTGYKLLDTITGGLRPGSLMVIGGRPGMGKTAFLQCMMFNACEQSDRTTAFLSFECSEAYFTSRLLGLATGVNPGRIECGALQDKEFEKIHENVVTLENMNIFFSEHVYTISEIEQVVVNLVEEQKIKVLYLDGLQQIKSDQTHVNVEETLNHVTVELKRIARQYKIAIVTTSELSRSVEYRGGDKRPILSDLRDSGSIEQYADIVTFLYRPEYYALIEDENGMPTDGIAELIIAKNKFGFVDTTRFKFDKVHLRFEELEDFFEATD
jgi:replicative DNA helicase